jgi:polycomb protein SUZ12
LSISAKQFYQNQAVTEDFFQINQPPGSAFSRFGPVQRTSITNVLVSKPKRTPPSLSEFLEIEENDLVRIQFKV